MNNFDIRYYDFTTAMWVCLGSGYDVLYDSGVTKGISETEIFLLNRINVKKKK